MYNYYQEDSGHFQPYLLRNKNQTNPSLQMDFGPQPNILDVKKATMNNQNYRTALWTGDHLQLTVMSIPPQEDIGLEIHPDVDQFLYIIDGTGIVKMWDRKDHFNIQQLVFEDDAIIIPAGTWHNVTNVGKNDLKLFSIYGPANHPWGSVHQTKEIAESMGNH